MHRCYKLGCDIDLVQAMMAFESSEVQYGCPMPGLENSALILRFSVGLESLLSTVFACRSVFTNNLYLFVAA